MTTRRIAIAALALSALVLVGCTDTDALPSTPSATSSASPSATASASREPTASAAVIPSDCRDLVSAGSYEAAFGETPLNDPDVVGSGTAGAVEPSEPPAGASAGEILSSATQLSCIWRDPGADITYLSSTVARVDAAVADQYLDELAAEGYTCEEAHGGRQCQLVKPNDTYPVDEGYTDFLRDDIYINVSQANFATNDLIGQIAAQMWG